MGFTLVELLVVLGIISLLMALALPVLVKVRRQARTILGMSNQREIVNSVNLYALDHDNRYPPSVATVGPPWSWNWSDLRKMTAFHETTLGPHRAMSEYLRSYIQGASTMFCPNAPRKYRYLQQAWDAGDTWDNPAQATPNRDAMHGTYCFYWNYLGILEEGLFRGPRDLSGGRGISKLLVSDYLGFGHWRDNLFYGNWRAYGSCESFRGANVTPGESKKWVGESAHWSHLKSDSFNLNTIDVKLHAGFADGHVESYGPSDVVLMRVSRTSDGSDAYPDGMGPGIFYLPASGLR